MKIALSGYGKMGHMVERAAEERNHVIVARVRREEINDSSLLSDCDVIIDFSHAVAIGEVVRAACAARTNLVIGTTGWAERLDQIRSQCLEGGIGVVYGSNFSPGANAMFALARYASQLFANLPGYAAGIEERHHAQKKDAPSGTAKRLALEVERGSDGALHPSIGSTRIGSEVGFHTLFFDSPDDLVEVSHRARSREGFARGAVLAAEMIAGKQGFWEFDELLGYR